MHPFHTRNTDKHIWKKYYNKTTVKPDSGDRTCRRGGQHRNYYSAARIGHPQIPTNPWSPTPERAIEAWPRPKAPGQQHQRKPPAAMPSRHATKWTNWDPTKITQCNWDPGEPWSVFSETVESDPIITAPHCISAVPPKQGQTPPSRQILLYWNLKETAYLWRIGAETTWQPYAGNFLKACFSVRMGFGWGPLMLCQMGRMAMRQRWSRWRLGAERATLRDPNQRWPSSGMHIWVFRPQDFHAVTSPRRHVWGAYHFNSQERITGWTRYQAQHGRAKARTGSLGCSEQTPMARRSGTCVSILSLLAI